MKPLRATRWVPRAAIMGALWASAAVAHAQPDEDPKAVARELAEQAQDKGAAGDHEGALVLLRRADETYHAPTIGLLIGRSLIALGRYAEAAEQLEDVATEELVDGAPDAWRNAVKLAADERAALDGKLGKLVVQVSPANAGATVRLGDRPARPARGEHVVDAGKTIAVVVEAPGYRPVTEEVTIAAGQGSTIAIALESTSKPPPPPPPSEEAKAAEPTRPFLHTPWPTAIGGGATLVTFAIGAGLGASAFADAGDIEDRCGDPACSGVSPSERKELRDIQESGGGTADASTAFFVISGVAAAATTVFAVVWIGSTRQPSSGASARLRGGTGWATLDGSF